MFCMYGVVCAWLGVYLCGKMYAHVCGFAVRIHYVCGECDGVLL